MDFDWETQTGKMQRYCTPGAACSEIEIDCLTGDHCVRRSDLIMDLGQSLNPAIDTGQIEGAFLQVHPTHTRQYLIAFLAPSFLINTGLRHDDVGGAAPECGRCTTESWSRRLQDSK